MSEELEARKKLTFEQAEGVEPLPPQLALKEVSKALRAALWHVIYESMKRDLKYPDSGGRPWIAGAWEKVLRKKHVYIDHNPSDEFDRDAKFCIECVKTIILDGDYIKIFGFLQFVLRERVLHPSFAEGIRLTLIKYKAAYRLIDGDTIMPMNSEEEAATLQRVFMELSGSVFGASRTHLKNAAAELTAGNYAASVRESIHAVESIARKLDPDAQSLGQALNALAKNNHLHPALLKGMGNFYGWTNDEQGIRHALIDDAKVKVDEHDALYMLGSCSAFVSYLKNKGSV
ncbi:AbiJ-NTD4 domain-containing protein [Oceanibaculum nanhaiense]|uniref:AbiJ-NTD4 domain-containing protein n=1 Tax=Oceanibaculum nanhaiense TaxID=1909734 RepID=UPI003D2CCFF1